MNIEVLDEVFGKILMSFSKITLNLKHPADHSNPLNEFFPYLKSILKIIILIHYGG